MFGRLKNADARHKWVQAELLGLVEHSSILDVGAGECAYKKYCSHLDYLAQDIAQYDGTGNDKGLHTKVWDTHQLDFVCDLYEIPEDRLFDAVLCTEVLEHVSDPVAALEKICKLVKSDGKVIVTAPFCSLTHFAPYHYATGFSEYFYKLHLPRLGFVIEKLEPNGGYFDFMDQEIGRIAKVRKLYGSGFLNPITVLFFTIARLATRVLASLDGPRNNRRSSELLTFGWHVVARKL